MDKALNGAFHVERSNYGLRLIIVFQSYSKVLSWNNFTDLTWKIVQQSCLCLIFNIRPKKVPLLPVTCYSADVWLGSIYTSGISSKNIFKLLKMHENHMTHKHMKAHFPFTFTTDSIDPLPPTPPPPPPMQQKNSSSIS